MGSIKFQEMNINAKSKFKLYPKRIGFYLCLIASFGIVLSLQDHAQAAPSYEQMEDGLFGNEGVLWQALNWARDYYLAVAGTTSIVVLVKYWLDTVKNG